MGLAEWFDAHPYTKFFCTFWALIVIPWIFAFEHFKPKTPLSVRESSYLLEILSRVVGKKLERFGSHLGKIRARTRRGSAKETFKEITQPDVQIGEIVQGIWQFFEATKSDENCELRVALARMGASHIEAFECYYPPNKSARSTVSALQCDQSGFSRTKRQRKLVVVENIREEASKKGNARFVITREDLGDEEGSMVCFPVEEPSAKEIPYVISVCSSKPGYFKESSSALLEEILEPFGQRIALEFCLKEIKQCVK